MTKQQEENLEASIRALGGRPSVSKGIFNQVLAKLADACRSLHDEDDKSTEHVITAYAVENFEMAMYHAMEAFASAIGDQETARLARRTSSKRTRRPKKIWPHIGRTAGKAAYAASAR